MLYPEAKTVTTQDINLMYNLILYLILMKGATFNKYIIPVTLTILVKCWSGFYHIHVYDEHKY